MLLYTGPISRRVRIYRAELAEKINKGVSKNLKYFPFSVMDIDDAVYRLPSRVNISIRRKLNFDLTGTEEDPDEN